MPCVGLRNRGAQPIGINQPEQILRLHVAMLRRELQLMKGRGELLGPQERLRFRRRRTIRHPYAGSPDARNPRFRRVRDGGRSPVLRNQTARGQRQQQAGATHLGQFHAASYLCRRSQILWRRIHAACRQSNLVFGLNKDVAFHRHAPQTGAAHCC